MAAPLAGAVVLVVDDEPMILRLMERTLAQAGYHVHAASNGLRALELIEQWAAPPNALVTDICMDGMNGVELARVVTRKHPSVQVLLVSGYDPDHTELAWPFLRKPFSPDTLVRAVEQLVAQRPLFGHSKAG